MNAFFHLKGDQIIEKTDPLVKEMKELIDKQYAEGRITTIGDDELVGIIDRIDSNRLRKLYKGKKD